MVSGSRGPFFKMTSDSRAQAHFGAGGGEPRLWTWLCSRCRGLLGGWSLLAPHGKQVRVGVWAAGGHGGGRGR